MIDHKMNPEWKQKWVDALRSGNYKQTQNTMCDIESPIGGEASYCCLGVLRYIASGVQCRNDADAADWVHYDDSMMTPQEEQMFDISDTEIAKLIDMNDEQQDDFNYIADYIDGNL